MKQRGFTLVELVITITIMLILLTLAAATFATTQANQRDSERVSEITTISNNLETFYKTGINTSTILGRYPSTALLANGATSIKALLPSIDLDSVTAPDATSVATSFIPATNAIQTTAGVLPQPKLSEYVYQPIQSRGAICTPQTTECLCTTEAQECRKYILYYRTENDNLVKKVVSKHQ